MAITEVRDKLRLKIGDTNEDSPLFYDEELDVFLADQGDDVNMAAAEACDVLATRFARQVDFAEDGQSFRLGQRSAAYRLQARDLRMRYGNSSVPLVSSVNTALGDNIPGYGGTVS